MRTIKCKVKFQKMCSLRPTKRLQNTHLLALYIYIYINMLLAACSTDWSLRIHSCSLLCSISIEATRFLSLGGHLFAFPHPIAMATTSTSGPRPKELVSIALVRRHSSGAATSASASSSSRQIGANRLAFRRVLDTTSRTFDGLVARMSEGTVTALRRACLLTPGT